MRCAKVRELIWDIDRDDIAKDLRRSARLHCVKCPDCAEELEEVQMVQASLRDPKCIDAQKLAQSLLRINERIEQENPIQPSIWSWQPMAGYIATAAVALFAIIALTTSETTALTIDALTTQHRICITEGHQKNYQCNTEAAFAEMTINELGLTAHLFEAPGGAFKKGDICRIGGKKVAHALIEIKGEMISYFRLYDASESVKKDTAWVEHSSNIWSLERKGHLVLLRQFAQGDYGIYTGKVSIADIEATWREVSP